MPQKRGHCIYCGGDTDLTKEHIFADWLSAYIPREMSEHRTEYTVTFPHKTERRVETRPGDTHARRLRRVCRTCNGGWMSKLQEAAKPYLVPMLEGRAVPLNRKAQKILAAWITMTAMTAEYLNEAMVVVPQSQRDQIRETSQTPKYWRIWIGQYQRDQGKKRFWHNALALTDERVEGAAIYAPALSNTQTTSICLGDHLFIHVMSSEVFWGHIKRWRFPPTIRPHLRQICPAAAPVVKWPPERALRFAEIDLVSDYLYKLVLRRGRLNALASSFPAPD